MLRLRQALFLGNDGKANESLRALDTLCAEYENARHPDNQEALIYECAASACYNAKQFDKAISLQKRAVNTRRKRWGADEQDTKISQTVLHQYEKR